MSPEAPHPQVGGLSEEGLRLPRAGFFDRHPRFVDGVNSGFHAVLAGGAVSSAVAVAVGINSAVSAFMLVVATIVGMAIVAVVDYLLIPRAWLLWTLMTVLSAAVSLIPNQQTVQAMPVITSIGIYAIAVTHGPAKATAALAVSTLLCLGGAWFTQLVVLPATIRPAHGTLPWTADPVSYTLTYMFTVVLVLLVPLTIGVVSGNRRRYTSGLVARVRDLARERDQQAQLATALERARIAREMHDIVAHNLTVIVTLADGAAATIQRDPAAATDAVRTIASTGRGAIGEMRRLLGLLTLPDVERATASGSQPGSDPVYQPQPGTSDIPALVAQFREVGLPVVTTATGAIIEDQGLQLTVYRIIAEGLTNVLRYSTNPTVVRVVTTNLDGRVHVEVTDDGKSAKRTPSLGSGRGLVGVRERAGIYGGSVESGPMPGGGWRLAVTLQNDGGATQEGRSRQDRGRLPRLSRRDVTP